MFLKLMDCMIGMKSFRINYKGFNIMVRIKHISSQMVSKHMKNTFYLLILVTLFFSCVQPKEKKDHRVTLTDTKQTNFQKIEKERLKKRKKIEAQEGADSLKLDRVLSNALEIAMQNIDKVKFNKKYEVTLDSSYNVKVEINLGDYFTPSFSHLIIRRYSPGNIYMDIYAKNGHHFEKVLVHEEWEMTYVGDTIRDINGDGLKDFVVNWYGSTGCCLKAFSNVYLLRADQKTFSKNFQFINPSFSPKEQVIRGVCYGHPGETEMYKYKWKGEAIDTLEYITYEKNKKGNNTGMIIVSKKRFHNDKNKVFRRLKSVPKEYKRIEGYDWFTGTGYKQ